MKVAVAAVAVVVALVVKVVVADKRAPKAVQVVHAMAHPLHVVAVQRKVHAVIAKIAPKEALMAHHQTVSTTAMIATTTGAMIARLAAMSCHVTLTPS